MADKLIHEEKALTQSSSPESVGVEPEPEPSTDLPPENERESTPQSSPQTKSEARAVVGPEPRLETGTRLTSGSPVEVSPHNLCGQTIGDRYQIGEVIGEGAWSTVYRGWHRRLNKPVAIKCLRPNLLSTIDKLQRFQFEAKVVGKLHHGNIVEVYDFGCYQDTYPYMIMDLVQGPSLAEVFREHSTISLERCARLSKQIAEALDYAHHYGVVHRDIKPENILLERANDGKEIARVADFGLAKAVSNDEQQTQLTQTGEIVGTPYYMSPEQCAGKPLDGRSDVYSLGCLMYECLTGRHTVDGRTTFDCMRKHLEMPAPPLFEAQASSPDELVMQDIVLTCLEKPPAQRPSAAELVRLLNYFLKGNHAEIKRMIGVIRKRGAKYRRLPVSLKTALAAAVALAALASVWLLQIRHVRQADQPAMPLSLLSPGDLESLTASPQQGDFAQSPSHAHLLETVFGDIAAGIKEWSASGNTGEARELHRQLASLQEQWATGKGTYPSAAPLQVISIGHAKPSGNSDPLGQASVVVTDTDSPVVLLLRSLEATRWNLSFKSGAKIQAVYLVGPSGKQQSLMGAPAGIPIKSISEDSPALGPIAPYDRDLGEYFKQAEGYTGFKIAAYQGRYESGSQPWVVGPESKDWRAQMIMRQTCSLHEMAMQPARQRALAWLATNKPRVSWFNNDNLLCSGQLLPPRQALEFLPGTIAGSWNIPSDAVIRVTPSEQFTVPPYTQPKILKAGKDLFAIDGAGILKLSRSGAPVQVRPGHGVNFAPNDYDLVFDTTHDRLIAKDSGSLYAIDVKTGAWKDAGKLRRLDERGKTGDLSAPYIQGMSYNPEDGALYFLEHGDSALTAARWLTKYSLAGEPAEQVALSYEIPMQDQGGDAFTQMYYQEPYVIAITSAPYESGKTRDPSSGLLQERDQRRYAWIIDPKCGRVLLVAPLALPEGSGSASNPAAEP